MEKNSMNSINNSQSKVISSSNNERTMSDGDLEESGWTMYFDDFFNQQNTENSSFSSLLESSLISDAAFSAANYNKVAGNEQAMGFSQEKRCDRFSFKKKKTKVVAGVDDDLEDTASSPAHSPKVRYYFFFQIMLILSFCRDFRFVHFCQLC